MTNTTAGLMEVTIPQNTGVGLISAKDGGIQMFDGWVDGQHHVAGWGDTPEAIADVLKVAGFSLEADDDTLEIAIGEVNVSSSMHSASECGFENNDDALKLWHAGLDYLMAHNTIVLRGSGDITIIAKE